MQKNNISYKIDTDRRAALLYGYELARVWLYDMDDN